MNERIGTITGGSLSHGFIVRIGGQTDLTQIKTGKFVTIVSSPFKFFALITDLSLQTTNPEIAFFPPTSEHSLLAQALAHEHIYAMAHIKPMLMCNELGSIRPVKTIPTHFCSVFQTSAQDIALIFGDENEQTNKYFAIGQPLDMDVPVCLDLERLTQRSTGIFGKTGTGKTFLTRLVLAGLVKNKKAVNLIFDMHSEYGIQARQENSTHTFVKGLKQLFPNEIAIFSLDPAATRRRGASPDVSVQIPYGDITVEDVLSLQHELNLHQTAVEAAYLISAKYGRDWLSTLLEQEDIKAFANNVGAHPESLAALYRKLKRLEHLPFLCKEKTQSSVIDRLMEYLERNTHVIIEFGNFTQSFCYLLVANIITRRIHELYIAKTERFLASQKSADEPRKLMITIEEAHKFLNPTAAQQTIFGTIAREMRKYYVSLLVVDQRPSGIDDEIVSQLGTKIIANLTDEKDVAAATSGIANAQELRGILASLDTKQQALVLGHAVAMPIVVQTRGYDEVFYEQMVREAFDRKSRNEIIQEIF